MTTYEYLILRARPGKRWEECNDFLRALARRGRPAAGRYIAQRKCWLIECSREDVPSSKARVHGRVRLGRTVHEMDMAPLIAQIDKNADFRQRPAA